MHILDNLDGNNLFNLDDIVLIDDRGKNQINLYKLKENIVLGNLIEKRYINLKEIFENMQTIDILYKQILPLSKNNNNLIIITEDGKVTLWKNENSKYIQALSIEIDQKIFFMKEIKLKSIVIVGQDKKAKEKEKKEEDDDFCSEKSKDNLTFYDFDNTNNLIKKGSVQNLEEVHQVCIINDKLIFRDISNILKVVDINNYQIVDKIILETSNIAIFNNKFGRLIVLLLYEFEYWYTEVLKEYSYENGKLIRIKTLKDINILCMAEGGNNLIAFGTDNGHVYIFK